jgi:hypothetical protein
MKKVIWVLFVTIALIWTALAWVASGLAQWTSDAITTERLAQATQQVALTAETVTRSMTNTLTEASGKVTERVATEVTQPASEAVAGVVQETVDAAKGAVAISGALGASETGLPPAPTMPPLPEWVTQWLAPEWVQWIKEWGAWAKAATGAGGAQVAQGVASQASSLTSQAGASAEAVTPWLASAVGWLVPIVWIIWGMGLMMMFVVTLIALWLVGQFHGGGPRNRSAAPI